MIDADVYYHILFLTTLRPFPTEWKYQMVFTRPYVDQLLRSWLRVQYWLSPNIDMTFSTLGGQGHMTLPRRILGSLISNVDQPGQDPENIRHISIQLRASVEDPLLQSGEGLLLDADAARSTLIADEILSRAGIRSPAWEPGLISSARAKRRSCIAFLFNNKAEEVIKEINELTRLLKRILNHLII